MWKSNLLVSLYAIDEDLVKAWEQEFRSKPLPDNLEVDIVLGDILHNRADAIVSPANSFGYMDGGIDLLYTEFFGQPLQKKLQDLLRGLRVGGELLVGDALAVHTGNLRIPWLISAPTMRTPQDLTGTINAYLATRAAIHLAFSKEMFSVLMPGMGTGCGNLDYKTAAVQMRRGIVDAVEGVRPVSSLWERSLEGRNLAMGLDTVGMHISGA
jgi:O-acetyl-ADP-ribose deacetylase (regulator of RNase III)